MWSPTIPEASHRTLEALVGDVADGSLHAFPVTGFKSRRCGGQRSSSCGRAGTPARWSSPRPRRVGPAADRVVPRHRRPRWPGLAHGAAAGRARRRSPRAGLTLSEPGDRVRSLLTSDRGDRMHGRPGRRRRVRRGRRHSPWSQAVRGVGTPPGRRPCCGRAQRRHRPQPRSRPLRCGVQSRGAPRAWLLHRATRSMRLDHFVMFSSSRRSADAEGQAAYAAANGSRRRLGAPAASTGPAVPVGGVGAVVGGRHGGAVHAQSRPTVHGCRRRRSMPSRGCWGRPPPTSWWRRDGSPPRHRGGPGGCRRRRRWRRPDDPAAPGSAGPRRARSRSPRRPGPPGTARESASTR